MKYLIIGLGNIGQEYAETRHNIGFKVLDALAESSNTAFKTDRLGDMAEFKFKGRTFVLVKPSTYMNLSGKAVNYWLQQTRLTPDKMLVVVDDIALPFGAIRIKGKGSDAGHNGLANIQLALGNDKYPRLRFGIGSDFAKGQQIDYVLGKWSDDEKKALPERFDKMIEAIKSFAMAGLSTTMNTYNGK